MELLIDGAENGFDGGLDVLDARFKWAGAFFGVFVYRRKAHYSVDRCYLYEIQILQSFLIFLSPLPIVIILSLRT